MSSSWGNPEYIILVADKRHEDNEVRTLGVRNTVCAFEVMLVAASTPHRLKLSPGHQLEQGHGT